jgi:DNA repair exonuclease SbcCD ATPase subunit
MTQVHNEYDEICPVCNHPLGNEELEAGVDIHRECYWRVMDEYDAMKKEEEKSIGRIISNNTPS